MVQSNENPVNGPPTDVDPEVDEEVSVKEATRLAPKLIYEVIRRAGEEELARTTGSLIWSGITAGILISFSLLGEAIFRTYLPDTPQRYLIENLGYSLGFLLVIAGRMQLFTENTITTVLPLVMQPSWFMFGCVARLWGIVLTANVVGAFAIAALYVFTPAVPAELSPALLSLAQHATTMPPVQGFFRAIPAGILIAALVWMMAQSRDNSFFVIVASTWLIAAGDFAHIVVGSVEMAYLVLQGMLSPTAAGLGFFLPVLAGNVVGGTVVFSLLAWGQVKDEVDT